MIYILLIVLISLIDRSTKMLIETRLQLGESHTIFENILYFSRTKNPGIAFGAFQNGGIILIGTTLILIAIVIYMMYSNRSRLARIGFSFILGGAFGNLYDRVFLHGITDFIDIPPLSFIFPNFNIADGFIVTGTIITAIYLLFFSGKNRIRKDQSKLQESKFVKIKDKINGK